MQKNHEVYSGVVFRSVQALEREEKSVRSVNLERSYETTLDGLWQAITNKERLSRWFLPVSGELSLGGRYTIDGNAAGTIIGCVPLSFVSVTWEIGEGVNWVELRMQQLGEKETLLTLSHITIVDDHWRKYGPGAVGIGWDLALIGLAVHLSGEGHARFEEEVFTSSTQGKGYIASMSKDWCRAAIASGENLVQAEKAAKLTAAFYTGE